ncbi:tRNA (uracil(54)-C(5))-methyltransferase [Aspergillus clavatus NRRL 1]|uniref:tRNA (uracil(54)-C(5))-methyltransferase n=1 Tax=Aspergillus clavatus (strain ATCC 1007 / CBS 513.65 / DSM 816 / NCTC 3887 / NRRL 1 / QM 1276 / 107) TaxID=344612 RepID=A1CBA7_ASPCL|nr:tRNA(m5U54)methyltransferase [Aspergillus clavatus NRRL 1]EAW13025.1 tRNA(m5U54)methyltransferase [Aspergillus clavatus NRRL 1]
MFSLRSLSSVVLENKSFLTQTRRFAHSRDSYTRLSQLRNATGPINKMQNSPRKPQADQKRRKKGRADRSKNSGFDEVLQTDIDQLLLKNKPQTETDASPAPPVLPELFTEFEVTVSELSSTGDGLALSENKDHVYVVPFSVPGDKVLVKVVRHHEPLSHSLTDFIKVLEPGPQRNDAAIGCKYFGKCSGCQLQMMSYEDQLAHKKRIVEKAYANFSGLIPELIPAVDDTFASPLQYGYRTKLTPHFAAVGGAGRGKKKTIPEGTPIEVPPIGFTLKNRRLDLDIEDCPLGTDIVRRGLKTERKRVAENIHKYITKGATLLMRESTKRIPKDGSAETDAGIVQKEGEDESPAESGDVIRIEHDKYIEEKRCVTDNNATSVEYIDDYIFTNKAGAFFQNNNSILSGFTDYIRQLALPKDNEKDAKPIKYLLDAYSGSGLFTITLSPLFKSSLGVDVAGDSIISARENARANALPNTGFAAADAAVLFKDVPYPPEQTLLVIDPPRKGCSDDFLRQLLSYGPRRVVYVSCNVHTQARDVAVMVQGDANCRYEIESIRGFDFFPQTGHVEGVAILNKVPASAS